MDELHMISTLLEDVRAAHSRQQESDTQTSRREFIRALFAAIDGISWLFRQFVRENLRKSEMLGADEDLALSEMTYTVSNSGKVAMQPRFLSPIAAIKLAARMALRADPDLKLDFHGPGWEKFGHAVRIRNRIAHPRTMGQLEISDQDLTTCLEGFDWFIETIPRSMAASLKPLHQERDFLKEFLSRLEAGDPNAWSTYYHAQSRIDLDP